MIIEDINVEASIKRVGELLESEQDLSPALKSSIEVLLLLVILLLNRFGLHSKNSSKPPSMDPNRKKEFGSHGKRKPGGQNGHEFSTLQLFQILT